MHLGHATLVVDHFHVIKLANAVVDDVRRRVQQAQTGHRGRAGDPLYGVRKLLLASCEDLDSRGWRRLAAALTAGDPDGQVLAAWQLKEITRDLYRATGSTRPGRSSTCSTSGPTPAASPSCAASPALSPLAGRSAPFHTTGGASNGPTEAVNLSIKQIKPVGRGFTNFDNYRLRLLLHSGGVNWHTQPAARLRGRDPQMAA